jgi:6-phosphofructokinase
VNDYVCLNYDAAKILKVVCSTAGGHNVIGGLLDFLLERHPGSCLLGFKNGPSGILNKAYMEITEEVMVGPETDTGMCIATPSCASPCTAHPV